MAVPKKKTSPMRRGMRRSHDGIKVQNVVQCKNCKEFRLSHHVCKKCEGK